ncbi:hypothetical protein [Amycolatopsis sp. CA-230715]|uniref:hypothetical protein n=1 Tax=Amycolatopsis sp. CA-230715 TaxID=2745196 RepID=UPI001C0171D7|nr:hypothetical protein [Amycolatopsis sp. CA-230715]QWF81620.1 hypothetical protein HUW46_05053 [Amycolatopsis sp. CA-230715]
MSPPPSLRVVVRWYSGDLLAHLYLASEMGQEFLVPMGHTWWHASAHRRDLLSQKHSLLPPWDTCASCARWLAANRYTVLILGAHTMPRK